MPRQTVSSTATALKINESSADLAGVANEALMITGGAFAAGGTAADAGGMNTAAIRTTHVTARDNVASSHALLKADLALMALDADEVRQRANRLIRSMQANGLLPVINRTDRPLPVGAVVGVQVTEIADATVTVPATTFSADPIAAGNGAEAGCWDEGSERDTALTELVDDDDDNDNLEAEFVLARADIALAAAELNHLLNKAIDLGLYDGACAAGQPNNT